MTPIGPAELLLLGLPLLLGAGIVFAVIKVVQRISEQPNAAKFAELEQRVQQLEREQKQS